MRAATAALSIPLLSVASAVTRGFSVVLTGQDGFSSDQARGFQPIALSRPKPDSGPAPGPGPRPWFGPAPGPERHEPEFSAFERAEFPDPCGP